MKDHFVLRHFTCMPFAAFGSAGLDSATWADDQELPSGGQTASETAEETSEDAGNDKPNEKPKTVKVQARDLMLTVPADWEQQKPKSRLRLTQFRIPAVKGDTEDAELTVFTFGGGSVEANVRRWIGQFQPEGRRVKTSTGECEQGKYVIVELSGTYNQSIGPPIQGKTRPVPNSRMLAVILATEKKGVYYLKATGSEKTIAAETAALRAAFGGDAKREKPYKPNGDG